MFGIKNWIFEMASHDISCHVCGNNKNIYFQHEVGTSASMFVVKAVYF